VTEALHTHGSLEFRLAKGGKDTELYNRRLKTHEFVQRIRASSAGQLARKEALRCLPLPAALLPAGRRPGVLHDQLDSGRDQFL